MAPRGATGRPSTCAAANSRVAVAALVFGEFTQRVEPPGQQRPYRESPGQLHGLIEMLGGVRFAAGQQDAAQVTGADHHVNGRVGPPGDVDGLGRVVPGRFQLCCQTWTC